MTRRSQPPRRRADTHGLDEDPRYRFGVPEGLEELTRGGGRRERLKRALLERVEATDRADRAQEIYWLAVSYRVIAQAEADPEEGVAALSTAWDAVQDPGFRHLLVCNLAGFARHLGALDDAAAWLARADPAPSVLELDSDVRGERALLRLAERRPGDALEEVGPPGDEARCERASQARLGMVRVAALEALERPDQAEAALSDLLAHPDVTPERLRRWLTRTEVLHPARETWIRMDPEAATGLAAPRRAPTALGFAVLLLGGVALTGFGLMGEMELSEDADWTAVEGTVISARGEPYEYEYPGHDGATRVGVGLAVHVRYRYGAPPTESDRYSLDDPAQRFSHRDVDRGHAHLERMTPGASLTVYVDPDRPGESVLSRRDAAPRRGVLAGGVAMLLAAFGVLLLHRRRADRYRRATSRP